MAGSSKHTKQHQISTSILHCFDVMCLQGDLVSDPGVVVWFFVPFLVLQLPLKREMFVLPRWYSCCGLCMNLFMF